MPAKKYALVEFLDLDGGNRKVAIVPSQWIMEEEGMCWWPTRKTICVLNWVVNCKAPDHTSGEYYTITRVMATSDNYGMLVQSEKRSMEMSDVGAIKREREEQAEPSGGKQNRTVVAPERFKNSVSRFPSSDYQDFSQDLMNQDRRQFSPSHRHKSSQSPPPSKYKRNSSPYCQHFMKQAFQGHPPQSSSVFRHRPPVPQTNPPSVSPSVQEAPHHSNDQIPARFVKEVSRQVVNNMEPYFERLHKHIGGLESLLRQQDDRLGRIEERVPKRIYGGAAPAPVPQTWEEALPPHDYPIEDNAVLMQMNDELRDPAVRRRAIVFLSSFGGVNVNKTISFIIRRLIGPMLGFTYTLTGRTSGKRKLQDLDNLLNCIYGATRIRFPLATIVEMEKIVGNFFSRSCDRGAQKLERQEARRRWRALVNGRPP